jgi:predicted metal-dependent HD superfamily phosphohydrolase
MDPTDADQLAPEWHSLMRRLHLRDDPAVFRQLVHAYETPPRAYHNLGHILFCLNEFRPVEHLLNNPDAVEATIFFHDAIYDPRATDNELQSAHLAARSLHSLSATQMLIDTVYTLILDTQHRSPPSTPDGQYLVDIDLAILGRSPAEFDTYDRAIREEYAHVPEPTYRPARAKVLRSFLSRPHLYHTPHFQRKYAHQAHINLANAIAGLES